jgi:YqjK-like protein
LQSRCAAQRAAIAYEVASVENRLVVVDRGVAFVRSTLLNPVVLVAATATLLFVGRLRGLGFVGRVLLLSTAARRLMATARKL